ncbi:MAG: class I SAM-dependent methyltransferase [bacterium]
MNWHKYYQAPLALEGLLGNLYGQRNFLSEILNSGACKILEVGTGSGAMSIFFSWLGLDVTGIDVDPQVIDKAKQESARLNGRAQFAAADAFQLPYPDNSFELIFHQGVLEHFSDDDIHRMLTEQLRVAPRVVFSVPNQWYPQLDFGNERLMSKANWEKILSPFRVVKSVNYEPRRFPKWYVWRAPVEYMAVIERK